MTLCRGLVRLGGSRLRPGSHTARLEASGTFTPLDLMTLEPMTNRPRYTVDKLPVSGAWVVRDTKASAGTQVLAILQDKLAAEQAAQALNRGLCESVDSNGRWEE